MNEPSPLLRCTGIDIRIGTIDVARGLNIDIKAGQCWCILGANGIGKTTLLHTIAGLRAVDSGAISLGGKPLHSLSRKRIARQLGILFQDHDDSFPASVLETVLQGRHPHLQGWHWAGPEDHAIARQVLHKLGLEELKQRNIQTLSGGERQRVGIATLLAQDTGLMLLDEPTNHLDLRHRLEILAMLSDECRHRNKTVIMTLHDINLAARFADHVLLLLGNGECRHGSKENILETALLERLYNHPLIAVETPSGPAWLPQ